MLITPLLLPQHRPGQKLAVLFLPKEQQSEQLVQPVLRLAPAMVLANVPTDLSVEAILALEAIAMVVIASITDQKSMAFAVLLIINRYLPPLLLISVQPERPLR